ncbi:MAG TPA: site-specific integrase [Salinivirgaceae bacterium]|nr:site-specific integrase [Salinivirgaceae bacterium]
MATIISLLSSKVDNSTGKAEISVRLRHGKNIDQQSGTFIYLLPDFFSKGKIVINQRIITQEVKEAQHAKWKLENLINYITTSFQEEIANGKLPRKWLYDTIDKYTFPEKYEVKKEILKVSFFDLFSEYIQTQKFSQSRINHFMVLYRCLKRFELYNYLNLDIDTITSKELNNFNSFLANEHKLFAPDKDGILRPKQSYKKIYETFQERRIPQKRGDHYISGLETLLKTFFLWCIETKKTTNNPFKSYSIKSVEYGTPYYLTLEERDKIYSTDLTAHPQMDIQKDIFIFHCFIGCRVSDLLVMTYDNIKLDKYGKYVEYMPQKTIDESAKVVKVYLSKTALEILDKYKSKERKSLLPFISSQKYNDYIKKILHACEIDRKVTILNPTTGKSEQRCIADIASSHLARRTFIGNLYKKVKDPNLVGKLSGHKEGSKAFARYRDIDDEMICDLTNLL